jgi:hypothetical protein
MEGWLTGHTEEDGSYITGSEADTEREVTRPLHLGNDEPLELTWE